MQEHGPKGTKIKGKGRRLVKGFIGLLTTIRKGPRTGELTKVNLPVIMKSAQYKYIVTIKMTI